MKCRRLAVLAVGSALSGPIPGAEAGPAVFVDLDFDAAKAEAELQDKLLLVDTTATWCPPCRQMDKEAWVDADVEAWIPTHAVAIQIDVGTNQVFAETHRVRRLPTMIVYKDGREFDRIVGYRTARHLLQWLGGVLEGRRETDLLREVAGDRAGPDGHVDVQARLWLAEATEAIDEFLWLWDNMLRYRPSMSAVRRSFMVSHMQRLAAKEPDACDAFTKLRDRYTPAVLSLKATRDEMLDWIRLNQVIGDEEASVAWFDLVCEDPAAEMPIGWAARDLFDLLVAEGRWAEAGRLHRDPGSVAGRQRLRWRICSLYAACLAAHRDRAADDVASVLLGGWDDAVARMALVEAALNVNQPRHDPHWAWIDKARELGGDVAELQNRLILTLSEGSEHQ